ncbi:transposable element Tcb2 transposase [Trichonephila clavipes]|nr:transposable element Tcb2 transposase [Trichonephila clavipes]
MWSMVAQRLTQITPPTATSDQLWQRVEAAWSAVPQEHIQSLFESIPMRVAAPEVAQHDAILNRMQLRSLYGSVNPTPATRQCLGGVGTSGSERCHLHEDQAQDVLDRQSRREDHHLIRNARVQPTASSAAIQARVAPSLGAPASSRTIRRHLVKEHLGSRRPLRVMALTPTHQRLRLECCRARENWTAVE